MKTRLFLVITAIATVITSCGNGDEVVNNSNDRVAVRFTSAVADVTTRVNNTQWEGSEHIGIFMVGNGKALSAANILERADNYEYKTTTTGETATFTPAGNDTIYYPTAGDVNFIAYYPYSTQLNTYGLSVNVSSQTMQSALDLLYAKSTAYNKNSGSATLPFEHKLVKLVFNISNGSGVIQPLTGLEVKITNQQTTDAIFDLATGTLTGNTGGTSTITAKTAGNGELSEAIVLPLTDNSSVQLTFTNQANPEETFTSGVPAINGTDKEWKSGNRYIYQVVLKKNEAAIQGTIEPWIDNAGTISAE
jgi:hypothetical protein